MGSGETTIVLDDSAGASQPSFERSLTATSPADALLIAEIERTRGFIRVTLTSIVGLLLALPLFDGNPLLERILVIVLFLGALSGVSFYLWIRDPRRYSSRALTLICLSAVINAQIVVVYFGVFSAAVMLLVLGVYFVSRSESAFAAITVYVAIAVQQAVCAGAIMAGFADDPGLMKAPDISLLELGLAQVFVQGIFLAAYYAGRSTRATTSAAMHDLQRAMQVAAQRGALLNEARADLDRALHVDEPGPFTGRVLGDYRLGVVIGRGAMGDVYAATHVETEAPAAVKLLPTSVLGDPRYVERFMREARAASAIESPHVVHILAASAPDDPLPYLVMEQLEGHDLAHELRQVWRLPLEEVCELVRQLGGVVDLARDLGIVHRDLKPQNVYFARSPDGDGVWKVLDFGVAAVADQSGNLSQGQAVGTPSYMAPEQARSQAVDHRADLYAVAAIAYRCITGRPAFAARDVPALLYDVVHKMPERPSELVEVPEDIDHVLAIGLAKRREDRFDSGRELADALEAACAGRLDPTLRERGAALIAGFPWGVRR